MQVDQFPSIELEEYEFVNSASNQVHVAAQYLAMASCVLVPPEADDSHTNLGWDTQNRLFFSHALATAPPIHLCLDPIGLRILLVKNYKDILDTLELTGKSQQEGLEWVKGTLISRGLNGSAINGELHYEMPSYGQFGERPFSFAAPAGSQAFSHLRTWGELILNECKQGFQQAPEVRTWPHHFDHGTNISVAFDDQNEAVKSMGLGLAIHDDIIDEHYFYINHWKKDGMVDYSELPPLTIGEWNRKGWTGATYKCSDMLQIQDHGERLRSLRTFFHSGIAASLQLIGT